MLNGFEIIAATHAGSTFIGAPWRVVLHTTEGDTVEGAVGAFTAAGSWPHFTVDVVHRRSVQHYELSTSARALLHPTGTPETNRANAIQIELVGNAVDAPYWSSADLEWLAHDVLTPIRVACPFVANAPTFVRYPDSYGVNAKQRMTDAQWSAFSGICGHEHVPHNEHGDPGEIQIDVVLAALGAVPPPAPVPPTEVDMPELLVKGDQSDGIYITNSIHKRRLLDPQEVSEQLYVRALAGVPLKTDKSNAPWVWPQHLVDRIVDA